MKNVRRVDITDHTTFARSDIPKAGSEFPSVFVVSTCILISELVGGIPTPLKNMKVSWDDDIPNIWRNKKCSKPSTR